MLHTTRIAQAGKEFGIGYFKAQNYVRNGLFLSSRDQFGVTYVDVEECKWALYWYDYFLKNTGKGMPHHERVVVARNLVILLRDSIAGMDGTFFHDFKMPKKPTVKELILQACKGWLMGVGLGFIVVSAVRLFF
jgi:hypothetical protein